MISASPLLYVITNVVTFALSNSSVFNVSSNRVRCLSFFVLSWSFATERLTRNCPVFVHCLMTRCLKNHWCVIWSWTGSHDDLHSSLICWKSILASSEISPQLSISIILLNSPCLWNPMLRFERATLVTSPPTPLHSPADVCGTGSAIDFLGLRVGQGPFVIYFPKLNSILFLYFFSSGDPMIDKTCKSGNFFLIFVNASFTISSLSFNWLP